MNKFHELLQKYKLSPVTLYVLWCNHYKLKPVGIPSIATELRRLTSGELIDGDRKTIKDGLIIINQLEKPKNNIVVNKTDIEQFLDIFPKGKLPSGKLARANPKTIEDCFKWFFYNYDYSWETIIKATKAYVSAYEDEGYKYMRSSQYFIVKTTLNKIKESELANYCELVLGKTLSDSISTHFKDNII